MKNQNLQKNIETLYNEKIVEKIASKLLFNLFCRGNNNAYDIYTRKNNGIITIKDLSQEMYLFLCENSEKWCIDNVFNTLSFLDSEIEKDFFKIVSNELYNNIRKHERKKLWIELDDELVKIDDIPTLASHVCIDNVITLSDYQSFCDYLYSVKPKKAKLFIDFINARLQGLKIKECAIALNIKESVAFDCAKQLKILWKNFHK